MTITIILSLLIICLFLLNKTWKKYSISKKKNKRATLPWYFPPLLIISFTMFFPFVMLSLDKLGMLDSEDVESDIKYEPTENRETESNSTISYKYCSKHDKMYSDKCFSCTEESFKNELNKPGGFRDRVSRF